MTTGIIFDQAYLNHEQSSTHPERHERLSYTMDQLVEEGIFDLPDIRLISPRKATRSEILAVHSSEYIAFLEEASLTGGMIDYDTTIPRGLFGDALLAAGGAVIAADAVLNQDVRNAFVLCRPPRTPCRMHVRWRVLLSKQRCHSGQASAATRDETDSHPRLGCSPWKRDPGYFFR